MCADCVADSAIAVLPEADMLGATDRNGHPTLTTTAELEFWLCGLVRDADQWK